MENKATMEFTKEQVTIIYKCLNAQMNLGFNSIFFTCEDGKLISDSKEIELFYAVWSTFMREKTRF